MYALNTNELPHIFFYGNTSRICGWGHAEVQKPHHLLVFTSKNRYVINIGENEYNMEEGSVLFIPKNTPYSLTSTESFEHMFIYFDADISAVEESDENYVLIPQYAKANSAVQLSIERAIKVKTGDALELCERRIALLQALTSLARLSKIERTGPTVKKIRAFLEAHVTDRFSLDALANDLGYSKQYVIRVFKKETGATPMAALNELRLLKSTSELLNEEKSIAEVAESCGFDDYNYFSRLFRRRFGNSPREYRKNAL